MSEILTEDLLPEKPESVRDLVVEWRFERLRALGFTEEQALVLAYTKNHEGNFLYWEDVSRLLNRVKEKHPNDAHNTTFDLLS